jgi:kynurenine formamidase
MKARTLFLLLVVWVMFPLAASAIDETKIIDLSYSFGPETIYWPTAKSFELEKVSAQRTEAGYWYAANNFCMAEHGGTHMDAPIHFAEGQKTAEQVPLGAGIGPIARIDVSRQAAGDPDYRVTVADLLAWEKEHGRIPDGAIVVMFSDWGKRWPDRKGYLGSDTPRDTANLHFPAFSKEAAEFLVNERVVDAIGVDTPSLDHGPSKDFIVHQIINGAGKPGFENLANLDRIPPAGATLIALPVKIVGGSGAPMRAVAILP